MFLKGMQRNGHRKYNICTNAPSQQPIFTLRFFATREQTHYESSELF
jgi:hypothetical protein